MNSVIATSTPSPRIAGLSGNRYDIEGVPRLVADVLAAMASGKPAVVADEASDR
jgi:hypothetical protein